ncbi:hypothetical protein EGN73_11620 [Arthrospiribacter ruber]|uniref:DUF4097 domain-containing protein n=2 Tax=Arthrospiribacter ruber TaxID=2487934 RepID=A0A951IYG4_9BACT|nr:hypothetical protein [Arthrospiribacter ruber]
MQGVGWAMLLLVTSCYFPENTETVDIEETFSGIKEIELNGRFLEVSYEGRSGEQEVFLSALLELPEDRGYELKYRKSGSKLKIDLEGNGDFSVWNFGINSKGTIMLIGPEEIKLDLNVSSGSVDVMNVHHESMNVKANSGSIRLMGVEVGTGNFTASSGSIRAEAVAGKLQCQVNSGSIRLKDVLGDVDAKASSGSIKMEDVQGRADAKVNSGSIRLSGVKEIGELSASSGNIRVEQSFLGPNSSFHANSGNVRVVTLSNLEDFNYDLSAGSGAVRVGESSGRKNLKVNNNAEHTIKGKVGSGSIRIVN